MPLDRHGARIIEQDRALIKRARDSGDPRFAREIMHVIDEQIWIAGQSYNPSLFEELVRELHALRDEVRELVD
jgi:hypothetical protein